MNTCKYIHINGHFVRKVHAPYTLSFPFWHSEVQLQLGFPQWLWVLGGRLQRVTLDVKGSRPETQKIPQTKNTWERLEQLPAIRSMFGFIYTSPTNMSTPFRSVRNVDPGTAQLYFYILNSNSGNCSLIIEVFFLWNSMITLQVVFVHTLRIPCWDVTHCKPDWKVQQWQIWYKIQASN